MRIDVRAKRFGAVPVLGSVTLDIGAGEIVALVGASGIGKTTLLRIVAGLDRNFDGRIQDTGRIGMVFQNPTLLPWRTVQANLCLTTGIEPDEAERLLAEVGLDGRGETFPNRLSLGQQRRLALARALAARPDTLLMDEPFASLDEETAVRMRKLTLDLLDRRGIATLIVTHDLGEAAALADRVAMLAGRPATLLHDRKIATPRHARDIAAETKRLRDVLL